jgi:hypothetical protein
LALILTWALDWIRSVVCGLSFRLFCLSICLLAWLLIIATTTYYLLVLLIHSLASNEFG